VAVLALVLVTAAFFVRTTSFSRSVLIGYWFFATAFVVIARRLASEVQRMLHERGLGLERVALVGGGETSARFRRRIEEQPGFGMRVVASIDGLDWRGPGADDAASREGRALRIRSLARSGSVDRVILTDPHLEHEERLDFVEECHRAGVRCDFVPDLFEVMMGRIRAEEIDGVPLVGAKLHPLGRFARMQKRTLDVVVSAAVLVVFAPLFAFVALAVKLDSPGPVLYRQRRLGRDGREFDILKFRSMPVEAESSGPQRATRGDDRATRVGAWLRRTSLDEIPQFVNVLRGEMSLVGPRPERPVFVGQFEKDVPRYLERHGVKSGITGWAQAHGLRGDTSIEERTRYDIWYVEHWSLALDLKILALTAVRFLFHKEAY
jgi:exopolysaccharide biosynthesis polyprenyl glycosylphosphotransferase